MTALALAGGAAGGKGRNSRTGSASQQAGRAEQSAPRSASRREIGFAARVRWHAQF